jgi:hypothetical protein
MSVAVLAPPADAADRGRTALRLLMTACLYAVPVFVTLRPGVDWDWWWHQRVGQWVVENRAVPEADPLAQEHAPWVAYSWLFEVLAYGLWSAFGLAGPLVFQAALSLAVVAALHRLVARRQPHFLKATALTGAAVLALAMLFKQRPWLFTILFSALSLDAVLDLRAGRRTALAWLLPPLYAVWANVHIQFVYGLALLGLACVAPLLDRRLGLTAEQPSRPARRRLAALFALCALATLLNPYHVRLYAVVAEYATQPGPFRWVNELKAPEFREPGEWVVLGLAGAAAFALGRRQRLGSFDVLLLAVTAFLAFHARRDVWLLVLASVATLAPSGGPVADSDRFPLTGRRRAALAGLVALLVVLAARARGLSEERLRAGVEETFPSAAAAAVRDGGYAGPLFNDFNWGGFLIWELPGLPVVVDGRTNLHGDARIERLGGVWAGAPGWQDDPDLAAAGVVVADRTQPLAGLLRGDRRFRLVHEDRLALVFVRAR